MPISSMVTNALTRDESGVWILENHDSFGYTEGAAAERYLDKVLRGAADLSTTSIELEQRIRDWTSEYHLTARRAQLLSGFSFDRGMRVLEVGCGCGAITRFLGETFDNVVSVEGRLSRARIARLRTRDLEHVEIVCAPFQKVSFSAKFDVIFCVGVYEYSGLFVDDPAPYDAVLRYFKSLLAPGGAVVIAIENQFGLKYFTSSREDHLGSMFDGIEGYRRSRQRVRTFGREELSRTLRGHFAHQTFYYPYPDYKIPDAVVSEEFLLGGGATELVAQLGSRDYDGDIGSLFDESLATFEISRNGMLPFFSNSFLVIAGDSEDGRIRFDQLAMLYSSPRRGAFRTRTRVVRGPNGKAIAEKSPSSGQAAVDSGRLRLVPVSSEWRSSWSLQTELYLAALRRGASVSDIVAPCRRWLEALRRVETSPGFIPGAYLDAIWSNSYSEADGSCAFIDLEWEWKEPIPLHSVFIRAAYLFLEWTDRKTHKLDSLGLRSGRAQIAELGRALGLQLSGRDFDDFVRLESEFQASAFGVSGPDVARGVTLYLRDRRLARRSREAKAALSKFAARVSARLTRK
jgi:protein-L-isoaspartate O-methyltransferase